MLSLPGELLLFQNVFVNKRWCLRYLPSMLPQKSVFIRSVCTATAMDRFSFASFLK